MLRLISVVVSLVCFLCTSVCAVEINGARLSEQISGKEATVRIVFDLPRNPDYTYFSLKNPERVVIDLKKILPDKDLKQFALKSSLVKRVRYSRPKTNQDSRLVIELTRPATPTLFSLDGGAQGMPRLVVDLLDSQPAVKPQVDNVANTGNSNSARNRPKEPESAEIILDASKSEQRDIIIAIDAGHGGKDPGSIGPAGTYEKRITLAVAKLLESKINATKGLEAKMTRTGDYYVSPNKRPELARATKADLFVSIHADAFHQPKPRGASVWILSMRRADNELGRWLERTERHSELLGGAAEVITDKANERYLAETILGLSMDHSMASSYDLSELVIKEMKGVTKMHQGRPQAASLAVLTSPDIPSILVELGFISNPQEEKNLNWSKYRARLGNAIFRAIELYFKETPPDGTLWAAQKRTNRTHTVRSGESLSLLAQRYNVSVKNIKAANNLSSDTVRVGQLLNIPKT